MSLNGKQLPQLTSQQDLESAELGWYFDPASVVYAKFGPSGSARELVLRQESK